MNFADLPIFGLLQKRMSWLSERQSVLAGNIANASTPGFVPHDLRANDFASALTDQMRGGLLSTNALHIQPKSASGGGSHRSMVSPDSRSTPDGNAVVVEEQMLKVAETQINYAQAAGLYKKMNGMWRTALGGSPG